MDEGTRNIVVNIAVSLVGVSLVVAVAIAVASIVLVYGRPRTTLVPTQALTAETSHDPAWPNYLRHQRAMDMQALVASVRRMLKAGSTKWWRQFPARIVTWPILTLATLFDVVILAAFALVQLFVGLLLDLLFLMAVGVVRLVDGVYATTRRTEASCPSCYGVMDRPAYKCTGCDKVHRDIRPGRRGSFFRTCTCGTRLPTGVLRAAWVMEAMCQYCGAAVHRGAAVLQDVRIPVFGEPHAGKTRLIFAGFHDLMALARSQGVDISFPDDRSRERADSGLAQIAQDQRTVKTDWQLDPALTCQIGTGTKGALLHVFDAAGERFRGAGGHDDLRYLDDGHTLLFVVDPFAVPRIREQIALQPRSDLIDEHLPTDQRNPEDAYAEVVTRVRDNGTATKKQRLAVVVTKADVLAQVGVTAPMQDADIKDWLYEGGLHNVILAAAREFREVRYFVVASIVATRGTDDYPASAPFLWALDTRGFSALTSASEQKVVAPA